MPCHKALRDKIAKPQLCPPMSDQERKIARHVIEILRDKQPEFGRLVITIVGGSPSKYGWEDTLTVI